MTVCERASKRKGGGVRGFALFVGHLDLEQRGVHVKGAYRLGKLA